MNYGEIIRIRRNALGMNQAELAAKIGVSRNTVAGWETGHSRPDLDTLPALCSALRISLSRFFGRESKRTEEERHLLELYSSLEVGDREVVIWQMEAIHDRRAALRAEKAAFMVSPPKVVRLFRNDLGAAAGFSAPIGETQGDQVILLADRETEQADEIITVCGNSMEPTFSDGDQVLVQHTKDLRFGEIGIFLVDNEGYIKEYQADGLHSHNPAYKTMIFRDDQMVRCLGRVIGKVRPEQVPNEQQLRILQQ